MESSKLSSVSPLDGRYSSEVPELSEIFSEFALIKRRLNVEIEYLRRICHEVLGMGEAEVRRLDEFLDRLILNFGLEDALRIKETESYERHDVRALVRYLVEELRKNGFDELSEYVHLGLTSEDVNNVAYALSLKEYRDNLFIPEARKLIERLAELSYEYRELVMLARTHGQVAVPTTLGRELAVYCYRLASIYEDLKSFKIPAKIGGAVGTLAAHRLIRPEFAWQRLFKDMLEGMGLEFWPANTQILPHDRISVLFSYYSIFFGVASNLTRDLWLLSMIEYIDFRKGEAGSSTMPQKFNPVKLENAEGNFDLAINLMSFMQSRLLSSRLQRDLSDSTIKRNYGVALGHGLLAVRMLNEALGTLRVVRDKVEVDLRLHEEALLEAYQVLLRSFRLRDAFNIIEKAYKEGGMRSVKRLIENEVPTEISDKLSKIRPEDYIGYSIEQAEELVEKSLEKIRG